MIKETYHKWLQITCLLALLFIVSAGAQIAQAHSEGLEQSCTPVIKTGHCHPLPFEPKPAVCCPSQACHETQPIARDLGRPEYHTQNKNTHPLTHELRSFSPQYKAGQAFQTDPVVRYVSVTPDRVATKPLQSLASLRSVVLLH